MTRSAARPLRAGRPNIVLLLADQFCAHALSGRGEDGPRTPHLDALARSGRRFERAYTTFPLCMPARSSMLAGRMPSALGLSGNTAPDAGTVERVRSDSVVRLLAGAGYRCAFAGKFHAPSLEVSAQDGFEVVHPFTDVGLARSAAAWIAGREADGDPYFLVVSFDDPHGICEYARGQLPPYGAIPAAPIRDAPPLPANHTPAPFEAEAPRFCKAAHGSMYGTGGFSADDWRDYRRAYARLIERADSNLGAVLDAIAVSPAADNTVTVFTSDHGDGDAAHQWNQKTALFEECVRVPLVLAGPGIPPGEDTGAVSVGLDLYPTLCELARINQPRAAEGMTLTRDGAVAKDREVVIETAFDAIGGTPQTIGRAMISGDTKYAVYNWGRFREQLHDLRLDPGEQRNLAVESRFDDLLDAMRRRLLDWCARHEDTEFLKALVPPNRVDRRVLDQIYEVPY